MITALFSSEPISISRKRPLGLEKCSATVRSSMISNRSSSSSAGPLGPTRRQRSSDATTSSALSSSPLWNITPGRSRMVHTVPSALVSHDSASSGAASNSLVNPNSPSNTCPMMCGSGCETVDCQSRVCGEMWIATSRVPPYFESSAAASPLSDAGLAQAPATASSPATNPANSLVMTTSSGEWDTLYRTPPAVKSNSVPQRSLSPRGMFATTSCWHPPPASDSRVEGSPSVAQRAQTRLSP